MKLNDTTSLCSHCKKSIPAALWIVDTNVVLKKECPEHGLAEVIVSDDAKWYQETMSYSPVLTHPTAKKPVAQGCPFDCGPCDRHEQKALLPIVPITSACNLDCPICYTHNRNGSSAYHMSEDELRAILNHLRVSLPERRIINITGGEPTQHPAFDRLIELCHEEGIHRITLSTHGLRFLKDEKLLEKLARLDTRIILSFDSFKPNVNQEMLGGKFLESKLKVLGLLEKYRINTTLLPVLAKGQNDDELGKFIELALEKEFIRSVEFHTMTFTGQNGSQFSKNSRYTTSEVLRDIERLTHGKVRMSDFVPSPAAHPLCYSITYLMKLSDGSWLPYPRMMDKKLFRELLAGSLYLEPTPELETKMQEAINRAWSGEFECENSDLVLASMKDLIQRIFKDQSGEEARIQEAERSSKAVYVHAHMDQDNFDTDRIRQCCVGIQEPNGVNIPSCSYNVLYRNRDHRFTPRPEKPISDLGAGRIDPKN